MLYNRFIKMWHCLFSPIKMTGSAGKIILPHIWKVTSDFIASSVNVNPVVIRRLLQQLKKAGIVQVMRGSGGTDTARPIDEITLLDVYNAVECVDEGGLFHFHENPNQLCPVGRNIHAVLDVRLDEIQKAMEKEMGSVTIQDVLNDTKRLA